MIVGRGRNLLPSRIEEPAAAGGNQGRMDRIDVHHHFAPPAFIAALGAEHAPHPPTRDWTVEQSIDDMDRAGVKTAILSITVPGVWFGDDAAARRLARACNEYGAQLVADYPGRFGLFAALPFPDVDGSLAEIAYALDVLKADGIGFYTSYGKHWLGSPMLAPIYAELDRRGAIAYTHPTKNDCCVNLLPGIPESVIEYGTDTTRTIADLVFSGSATRYPRIRWIFSHAGGTMPFLIGRFTNLAQLPRFAAHLPNGILPELRRFHYDVAQSAHPGAISSLMHLVPVSQVLLGTDFPYQSSAALVAGLRTCGLSEADLHAIECTNARSLLPRLTA